MGVRRPLREVVLQERRFTMLTPDAQHAAVTHDRVPWLDNLRVCMVFLVVLLHAGGVYESSGRWSLFWIVDDPSTSGLLNLLIALLGVFVMPLLFFVSGYVTPQSLATKSAVAFLKARSRRLLIPWLIAVLTVIPLYKHIFLLSRNIPQEHWTAYFHWNALWGQNWLWFLPVLFLFDVLYVLAIIARVVPARIPFRSAVAVIFLAGWAYSTCMDLCGLRGWTHTLILDFQNERLLIYFMVFMLGAAYSRRQAYAVTSPSKAWYATLAVAACGTMALYYLLYSQPAATTGTHALPPVADALLLWLAFHVSLYCTMYLIVTTFQTCLNTHGPLSRILSANSYHVYIIHTIVLGGIATTLLGTKVPALWKCAIVTLATYVTCNLIATGLRGLFQVRPFANRTEVRTMKAITWASLMIAVTWVHGCGKPQETPQTTVAPLVNIHVAALQGHIDAVRQHIDAGTNLDEKDEYGSTPLIIAATFGKTDVARALVDAGADTGMTNNDGSTALHISAFLCRTEIVEMLLADGAASSARNAAGKTALDIVAGPFEDVRGIYDQLGKGLKPLGLRLDYDRLKRTRPRIARMLRGA